jgi:hypothetical protein
MKRGVLFVGVGMGLGGLEWVLLGPVLRHQEALKVEGFTLGFSGGMRAHDGPLGELGGDVGHYLQDAHLLRLYVVSDAETIGKVGGVEHFLFFLILSYLFARELVGVALLGALQQAVYFIGNLHLEVGLL